MVATNSPACSTACLTTSQKRLLVAPLALPACRGLDADARYRGVYQHARGWRGKVKFFGKRLDKNNNTPPVTQVNLSTHPTALDAAVELARWWEARLGPRWGEILRESGGRHGPAGWAVWDDRRAPWRVVRDKKMDRRRGTPRLYVVCWVRGERRVVPGYFADRRDAAHGLFRWLEGEYGRDCGPLLWFPEEPPAKFLAHAGC